MKMDMQPGDYRIDYFNKLGDFLPRLTTFAASLEEAQNLANEALQQKNMFWSSYTIMRCIINSNEEQ